MIQFYCVMPIVLFNLNLWESLLFPAICKGASKMLSIKIPFLWLSFCKVIWMFDDLRESSVQYTLTAWIVKCTWQLTCVSGCSFPITNGPACTNTGKNRFNIFHLLQKTTHYDQNDGWFWCNSELGLLLFYSNFSIISDIDSYIFSVKQAQMRKSIYQPRCHEVFW